MLWTSFRPKRCRFWYWWWSIVNVLNIFFCILDLKTHKHTHTHTHQNNHSKVIRILTDLLCHYFLLLLLTSHFIKRSKFSCMYFSNDFLVKFQEANFDNFLTLIRKFLNPYHRSHALLKGVIMNGKSFN